MKSNTRSLFIVFCCWFAIPGHGMFKSGKEALLEKIFCSAVKKEDLKKTQQALHDGAKIYTDIDDLPAIIWATTHSNIKMIALLLANGANPNSSPFLRQFTSPLICAAIRGDLEIVELLLQHGANPNQNEGLFTYSPLREAISHGDLPVAQTLIMHGANTNEWKNAMTTLMAAANIPDPKFR